MTDEDQPGDGERRARLNYWIRRGIGRRDMTEAAFARAIGAPPSTVNRWLNENAQASPDITWLGNICRALQLDPMLFATLPAIPADPLETFALVGESDLLTVTDATRLAQLDTVGEAEADPPAVVAPTGQPRTPRRQGARRCPPGPRDR